MSKKDTAAVNTETVAVREEPAQAREKNAGEENPQEKKMQEFFARLPDPCVYCGPSVRHVARQYTVYNGGIPDVLKEFIREHPAARGLLVSAERFASVRQRMETPGTGEYILFQKVRAEL